jgi:hypothetical protein
VRRQVPFEYDAVEHPEGTSDRLAVYLREALRGRSTEVTVAAEPSSSEPSGCTIGPARKAVDLLEPDRLRAVVVKLHAGAPGCHDDAARLEVTELVPDLKGRVTAIHAKCGGAQPAYHLHFLGGQSNMSGFGAVAASLDASTRPAASIETGMVGPFAAKVRAAQDSVASSDPAAVLATTTDRCGYSDPWHYGNEGYLDLGIRFAEAARARGRPR